MTPTLRVFLDAVQAGDLTQVIRQHSLLFQDLAGAAASDLWSFCIGAQFVTMKINTKLHTLFQSGEFSVFRHFKCTTGSPSHMMAQLEALLQTPGECSHVTSISSLSFTKHSNRNQGVVQSHRPGIHPALHGFEAGRARALRRLQASGIWCCGVPASVS
jgi:hypothetical protein